MPDPETYFELTATATCKLCGWSVTTPLVDPADSAHEAAKHLTNEHEDEAFKLVGIDPLDLPAKKRYSRPT